MNFQLRRGTLVADPEIKTTQNGKQMAIFSLAENHSKPVHDEKGDIVDWEETGTSFFDCIAFGEMAEEISYFEKGEHIEVTKGFCRQNKWEDQDGNTRYDYDFIINDFEQFIPKSQQ